LIIVLGIGSVSAAPLKVYYINVGQGDAEFIVSPAGKTLLIDAGESAYGSTVVNYIHSLGYTHIDYVLASHFHADHIGGLDEAVYSLTPTYCYDHGGSYSSTDFTHYSTACNGKRRTLSPGSTINLGTGVTASVLQANYGTDENGKSVVLKVNYGNLTMIFGGDCTSACEATISPGNLQVYKVHHHGSSGSTSVNFINNIHPQVSMIEVGAGNPYGHPTQQTLNRLAGVGSVVYRTDRNGTIVLSSETGATYTVNGRNFTSS
jgi:beta-lactamase superfamily II metal-dependent hydrolase